MTFLAGLELARRRTILLRQVQPFAELWLYSLEDGDDGVGGSPASEIPGPQPDPADRQEDVP